MPTKPFGSATTSRFPAAERSFSLPGPGKLFLLVVFFILLPAYGLSINLMLLLGALFAAMFVYNLASVWTGLRGIELEVEEIPELFANQITIVAFIIRNRRRYLKAHHQTIRLDLPGADPQPIHIDVLNPGETRKVAVEVTPSHRGWLTLKGYHCETAYPFGLVKTRLSIPSEEEILVYAELLDIAPDQLATIQPDRGVVPTNSGDYQFLASYQPGDDVRLIHWKKSTLLENPVLMKDLTRSEIMEPKLFVPDSCPHFEYAISVLTTYFCSHELVGWAIATKSGIQHVDERDAILRTLALIQPLQTSPSLEELAEQGYQPLYASQILPV